MSNGDITQRDKDILLKQYDKVIDLSKLALKAAMLINGGAAIALLAFFGGIWEPEINEVIVSSLTCAIRIFSAGALFIAISAAMGYASEFCMFHSSECLGLISLIIAVVLIVCSYVSFGYGVYVFTDAFSITRP